LTNHFLVAKNIRRLIYNPCQRSMAVCTSIFYLTRCSAIAERPHCRVRYSFPQK